MHENPAGMKAKKWDASVWVVSFVLVVTVLLNLVIFSIVFLDNCPQDAHGRQEQVISGERRVDEHQGMVHKFWDMVRKIGRTSL